jgi:hypothetical protein
MFAGKKDSRLSKEEGGYKKGELMCLSSIRNFSNLIFSVSFISL